MNKYVERLVKEWEMYGKIIVATDFDSTVSPYPTINNDADILRCTKLLQRVKSVGAYIVVHTCCDSGRYDDIVGFCKNNGVEVDSINKNPIELPFGHDHKPYANIFLDDRAGFVEAMDILEEACNIVCGRRAAKNLLTQIF